MPSWPDCQHIAVGDSRRDPFSPCLHCEGEAWDILGVQRSNSAWRKGLDTCKHTSGCGVDLSDRDRIAGSACASSCKSISNAVGFALRSRTGLLFTMTGSPPEWFVSTLCLEDEPTEREGLMMLPGAVGLPRNTRLNGEKDIHSEKRFRSGCGVSSSNPALWRGG